MSIFNADNECNTHIIHSFIHYVYFFGDDTNYNLIVVIVHSKQNITNLEMYLICIRFVSYYLFNQVQLIFYYF